ncbi:MarR family winged helix-turn-helix transcriptional regulator [Mucilaginibacter agri]|uniref:MarR family transcriptional regulator n=1 Tax=Mucilaginibacter agri TaxID=2695265 RepID=A0A966DV71_9SPHI|nr:MarR family transcriptional regulator [Mucilaginibacter agri]NCD71167.1 MarR family transcriptional regulator [Mucilaginibacter agri]
MKNNELASSLRDTASRMHKRLSREVKSADGFSLSERATLSYLYYNGPQFPSDLAAMAMIKAQSMSQIVNHLEELNIIAKTPSEIDKRKVSISLTDFGKQIVEQSRYERDQWLDTAIEDSLSSAEKKTLQEALLLMNKLINHK